MPVPPHPDTVTATSSVWALVGLLLLFSAGSDLVCLERGFMPLRPGQSDQQVLIIGNSAYPDAPLRNPVRDAVDVGEAFAAIGFRVTVVTDADQSQMSEAISAFGARLGTAKVAVFYYAGHGVQSGGTNWLIPVPRLPGEKITREPDLGQRAIGVNAVLTVLARARVALSMVVLDACRDNPFASGTAGLAPLDAPPGSIMLFATAPGRPAWDGGGRNSPFSQAFISQLRVPGQDIDAMMRRVKKAVQTETKGAQVPWSASSLTEQFWFVPGRDLRIAGISGPGEVELSRTQVIDGGEPPVAAKPSAPLWLWQPDAGRDRFGVYALLHIGDVVQRLRWIPPGEFVMGSDQAEARWAYEAAGESMRQLRPPAEWFSDAMPAHRVVISTGFWLADTPCTQALWVAVMGRNPSRFIGDANLPVEQVSWEDGRLFFARLQTLVPGVQATFPSEAQWEYACRAGSPARWPWGDDPEEHAQFAHLAALRLAIGRAGRQGEMWVVSGDDGPVPTYPVGRLAANAWGLHDMHGTLFQWCSDWYGAYGSGTQRDPRGPATGSQRVHRGGGWQPSVGDYRSAHRGQYRSGFRWFNLGLRLCIADR